MSAAAESASPKRLADIQPLLEMYSGHLAVLPGLRPGESASYPLIQWLAKQGLASHFKLLTAAELVDPQRFTAGRYPVTIYAGNEWYLQSFRQPNDCDAALRRYLGQGGRLLVLSSGPMPFYYNEKREVVASAPKFGFALTGRGMPPTAPSLQGVRLSFDSPPQGAEPFFVRNEKQRVITGLPARLPFPSAAGLDRRWRGVVPSGLPGRRYTPLLSLRDQRGGRYGDGAALIEHESGPLAGGMTAYVWCSLLATPATQEPLVAGLLQRALEGTTPPPAALNAPLVAAAPKLDGRLDEACWQAATSTRTFGPPVDRLNTPSPIRTTARFCWTRQKLLLAAEQRVPPNVRSALRLRLAVWCGEGEPLVAPLDLSPAASNALAGMQLAQGADGAGLRWEVALPLATLGLATPHVGDTVRLQLQCLSGLETATSWSPELSGETLTAGRITLVPDPRHDSFDLYPPGASGAPWWRVNSGTWRVSEGALLGENSGTDGVVVRGAAWGDESWTDYEFGIRFKVESYGSDWRDGPWFGFRCAANGNGYHLNFTDRGIQVHKSILGEAGAPAGILATAPWKRDTQWHELKLRVQANRCRGELDGKPLFAFRDEVALGVPSYRSGYIILGARRWSRGTGVTRVRFDDAALTSLPPLKRWSFE